MKRSLTATIALAAAAANMAVAAEPDEENRKCRALVLSGGSNRGAWEAGVIWGMTHYAEDPSEFAWDTVSGISAGAINTGAIATWETGTEVEMTEWLSEVWQEMTNSRLFIEREGGPINWLLHEPSIVDDSPALATLREIIASRDSIKRSFTVSAVDVQTGDFIPMSNDDTPFENLA